MPQTHMNLDDFESLESHEPSLFIASKYYNHDEFHNLCESLNFTKTISILNGNARSLVKHLSEYELLLECLKCNKLQTIDIITFTETWLDVSLEALVKLDNYNAIYKHKSKNKEGGGLAIYIANGMNFITRNDLKVPLEKQELYDCLFIEVVFPQKCKNIVIGVFYRSPSHNSENDFIADINNIFDQISHENKEVILLGDSNIDLLKYRNHKPASDYLDMLTSASYSPTITLPTRVTSNSATLIDHIFKKQSTLSYVSGTLTNDITDHFMNFILLNVASVKTHVPKKITFRPYSDKNIKAMNQALTQHNWVNVISFNNPCQAYDEFIKTYILYLNTYIPEKTVNFNPFKHKINRWITKGILKSMKTRDKLYNKWRQAKCQMRQRDLEQQYKSYRNQLTALIKIAKKNYWQNVFEESKHDMKVTWKNINNILKKTSNKSDIPTIIKDAEKTYTAQKEISNAFNSFYSQIGTNLAHKIKKSMINPKHYLPDINLPNSFALLPTCTEEIIKIVKNFKPKISCGYDSISPKLLCQTYTGILEPLVYIINQSLITGIVPQNMKLAKVIPIYKSGDSSQIKNYRPISLLPSFSKILERIVYNRLYEFLLKHNILTSSQYGFRTGMSTELAILELQDRIAENLSNKKHCIGMFLDLSKAFDTLNHSILLTKLEHYGIRGIALSWFKSYLSNRQQFTSINDNVSTTANITCGVPQGSILGPLLFLIYINDITNASSIPNLILFADDTNLIFENKDLSLLVKNVNDEINLIAEWFKSNMLSLNIEKTKWIHFLKKTQTNNVPISVKIDGIEISQVKSINFLGITIQNNLQWEEHIAIKANKIAKVNSILYRLKHFIPEQTKLNIYNALISPHLNYGLSAWGSATQSALKRLIVLQKKSLRAISNSKYNCHTNPLFKRYNVIKLEDIFKLNCCKLSYRQKLNILPSYHNSKITFNKNTNRYNTRQNHDIYIKRISINLQKQMLNYKIGTAWNNLPLELKSVSNLSLKLFVKKVKKYYLSSYTTTCFIPNCMPCRQSQSGSP